MDNLIRNLANADIEPSVHSDETSSDEESHEEPPESDSGTTTETSAQSSEMDSESSVKDDNGKISEDDESADDSEVSSSNKRKWMDEIRYYQQTTDPLIPRQPFKRLVREILQDFLPGGRITEAAINVLQTVTEDGFGEMFRISQMLAIHRGSVTVQPKDIQMARHTCQTFKWDL